uniref:Uncharacterized protein n=1 Tax=Glossina brevipalpis TaxID=37001 RepID=A0A1A9WQD6_9MUSC
MFFFRKSVNFFKINFCLIILFLDAINLSAGTIVRVIPAVGSVQGGKNLHYYSIAAPYTKSYTPTKFQSNQDITSYSNPLLGITPSCEELKAMWNSFSRRRARASEITNEIPTFHDPFTYNDMPPTLHYAAPRTIEGKKIFKNLRIPAFARVTGFEPIFSDHIGYYDRPRVMVRSSSTTPVELYKVDTKPQTMVRRPSPQFRYGGGGGGINRGDTTTTLNTLPSKNLASFGGSFQKLKQLIWAERSKELTQQRRAKEIYARAYELRDIAKGRKFRNDEAGSRLSKRTTKYLKQNERTATSNLINWIEYSNNLIQVNRPDTYCFPDGQNTELSRCAKWHDLKNLEKYLTSKLARNLLEKLKVQKNVPIQMLRSHSNQR